MTEQTNRPPGGAESLLTGYRCTKCSEVIHASTMEDWHAAIRVHLDQAHNALAPAEHRCTCSTPLERRFDVLRARIRHEPSCPRAKAAS